MRRTYISPEFRYNKMAGTFNMKEVGTYFGSKMMDIEDTISIDTNNVVYYQNEVGEQLNLALESNRPAVVYNAMEDKKANHKIELDPAQTQQQLDGATRWIIDVDLKRILTNYLFSTLKSARTFEGVRNEGTIYNSVNEAVRDYVISNVVGRYSLSDFTFYIRYVPLSTQGILRYKNTFSDSAVSGSVTTRVQTNYTFDKSSVRVSFAQELPSSTHAFDYYFTMTYNKT
jgi:hypothetical protein